MPKQSAGLLLYREREGKLEVFLVHPGGPLWARKDEGAWSIPKGEFGPDEDPLAAARREFEEETGLGAGAGGGKGAAGEPIALEPLRQPGGKVVYAWAARGDLDPARIRSNLFSIEWPPRSGRRQEFPEIDRAGWFSLEEGRRKILQGQVGFLDQLRRMITGFR